MKKPTGRNGSFHVAFGPQGEVSGEFQRVQWPDSKADIELQVAEAFVETSAKAAAAVGDAPMFTNLQRNAEDDYDFTVQWPQGRAYLELLEHAPLAGPYGGAQGVHNSYDVAAALYSKIMEKSSRYPGRHPSGIFLVVYVTHWAFVLTATSIACLRVWLAWGHPIFNAVFLFTPRVGMDHGATCLFPVPPELVDGFSPESVRDNIGMNLDPAKCTATMTKSAEGTPTVSVRTEIVPLTHPGRPLGDRVGENS